MGEGASLQEWEDGRRDDLSVNSFVAKRGGSEKSETKGLRGDRNGSRGFGNSLGKRGASLSLRRGMRVGVRV